MIKLNDTPLHFIAYLTQKYNIDETDVNKLLALLHDQIIDGDNNATN